MAPGMIALIPKFSKTVWHLDRECKLPRARKSRSQDIWNSVVNRFALSSGRPVVVRTISKGVLMFGRGHARG